MKRNLYPDFHAARSRRLLVALSGGADSVCLICMLADARKEMNLSLVAAHVNHCIRAGESDADAQYCRALCEKLNVPLVIETIDVPALRTSGEGMETAARRLRYDALRRIQAQHECDWIALAHHMDDQAETVLMHLLRGCGPDGIGGMKELSGDLYRPLLNLPKSALEEYLKARGVSWRVDATNFDSFTPRNALRLHGLPALEESYPQAVRAIARYAESAECENRYMDRQAQAFLLSNLQRGAYGCRILNPEAADEAILRRCIRKICPNLAHERLLEIASLAQKTRGSLDYSAEFIAERTPNALYFLPKRAQLPAPAPLPESGSLQFGAWGTMTVLPDKPIPVRGEAYRQTLDADALQGAILRTRQSGDRIRPLGSGEKLLSDYLIDRKIDRPLRDCIPILARGNRVLWAVGVGISEDAKLRPETVRAVWLNWNSDAHTSDK